MIEAHLHPSPISPTSMLQLPAANPASRSLHRLGFGVGSEVSMFKVEGSRV